MLNNYNSKERGRREHFLPLSWEMIVLANIGGRGFQDDEFERSRDRSGKGQLFYFWFLINPILHGLFH